MQGISLEIVRPTQEAMVSSFTWLQGQMEVTRPLASLPSGKVCKAIREAAGVTRPMVAVLLGVSPNSLLRFEEHQFESSRTLDSSEGFRRLLAALLLFIQTHKAPGVYHQIQVLWNKSVLPDHRAAKRKPSTEPGSTTSRPRGSRKAMI